MNKEQTERNNRKKLERLQAKTQKLFDEADKAEIEWNRRYKEIVGVLWDKHDKAEREAENFRRKYFPYYYEREDYPGHPTGGGGEF